MNPPTQKIKYGPEELIDVIKDISPKDYKILITAKENDKSEFDRLISLWDDGVIIEQFFEMTKTLKDDDLKKLKELGLSKIYPNYKTQKIDDVIKGDDDENKGLKDIQSEVLMLISVRKRTDATELIVKKLLEYRKIYTVRNDVKSEVWVYDKGIYIPEGKTYIKEHCRNLLGVAYTSHITNEVIAKIESDTYIEHKLFFDNEITDEVVINNGILNIYTKKLSPFTQDKIFFNKLPITYDTTKDMKYFYKHLEGVLKFKEDIPVIQELFGFCLVKDYFIEKGVMFSGSGRNGKGKTLEILRRFLGVENCVNIPLQEFEESNGFSKSNLHKKLANIGADISDMYLKDTSSFKAMTGRDLISADRKFLPRIHFINYAKMIFSANQLPKPKDNTPAFWNRWVVLEFPYTFLPQKEIDAIKKLDEGDEKIKLADTNIIKNLITDDEMSGILNWALDGLSKLKEQGDFSYSKNTKEVQEMWLRDCDSFAGFCMDSIEENWDNKITKQDLRQVYNSYCRKYKLKPVGDKAIKNNLSTNLGAAEGRMKVDDNEIYYWQGIKFREGREGREGFSTYSNITNLDIGSNTHPTFPSFPNSPTMSDKIGNIMEEVIDNQDILNYLTDKCLEIDEVIEKFGKDCESMINDMKTKGDIYEPKPGFIMRLN